MTYAVRVRLYQGDIRGPEIEPQADTDPDLKDGAPGSERAAGLEDVGQVLRELAEAMHPGAALLGLSDMANGAYLTSMREHIGKTRVLTYQQSYSVKTDNRVDWWFARVDVQLLVSP